MMSWKSQIKFVIHTCLQLPLQIRDYGWGYALSSAWIEICMVLSFVSQKYKDKLQIQYRQMKFRYLERYAYLVDSIPTQRETNHLIFVFWLQGLETAPKIVLACVDSIKKNTNYEVIVLNNDNYANWVNIPDYIIKKKDTKQMTIAAFSDVLRFALLARYKGSIWMDATLFLSQPMPDNFYLYSIITRKGDYNPVIVSAFRWTGFFIGGHSEIFSVVYTMLCEYWKNVGENGIIIDYFLVDYLLAIVYNNSNKFRNEIDSIPMSNPNIHTIEDELNSVYHGFYDDTWLYKLTYKKAFVEEVNNQLTYYKVIINKIDNKEI